MIKQKIKTKRIIMSPQLKVINWPKSLLKYFFYRIGQLQIYKQFQNSKRNPSALIMCAHFLTQYHYWNWFSISMKPNGRKDFCLCTYLYKGWLERFWIFWHIYSTKLSTTKDLLHISKKLGWFSKAWKTALKTTISWHGSDIFISDKIFWTSLGMVQFYLKFYAKFKYGRVK